ncbi:uncharacterized protein IWZ02DRAFT_464733 [Phyllosticta citriasiana]|uniref:uncharacterized protein n=1 Tax=Phyllosticta citriasiana TaxID=595635 RepID=UPI0030FD83EE
MLRVGVWCLVSGLVFGRVIVWQICRSLLCPPAFELFGRLNMYLPKGFNWALIWQTAMTCAFALQTRLTKSQRTAAAWTTTTKWLSLLGTF